MIAVLLQLLISGVLLGGIYAVLSIGLTLIFGVLEIINFAHGEFLMVSMYLTYWIFVLFGLDPYLSLVIVMPIMFLFGLAIEKGIIERVIDSPPINQIFVTIGIGLVLQNLALIAFKSNFRTVATSYSSSSFVLSDLMFSVPRVLTFGLSIAIIIILFQFLKRTYTGQSIMALAQERTAAMLMGIDVKRTYAIAFAIGTALVGAAGAMLMPIYYVFPSVGTLFVLVAFVVVILGGYNSLIGSVIGGLIIGLVETFSGYFVSVHLKEAIYFGIFILILLFRPSGLFGRK